MRHPRLSSSSVTPPLVAVAHGSKDPRAAATVSDLLGLVRSRAVSRGLGGLDVRAAFLDHAAPSLRQVLSGLSGPDDGGETCVVLPLLLTDAHHSKTDIPAQLASVRSAFPRLDVRYADTLGPHPLLIAALERRLAAAGFSGDRTVTSVVLAAAGSSDPAANATIAALAAQWQRGGGWRAVVPAYASAAAPAPAEAVRALAGDRPVLVATYLLAPGYFADKIRREALAAGAVAVSGALGAAPEVADVILDRYLAAAQATALSWQKRSYPERTVVTAQLITGSAGQTEQGSMPVRAAYALAARTA